MIYKLDYYNYINKIYNLKIYKSKTKIFQLNTKKFYILLLLHIKTF